MRSVQSYKVIPNAKTARANGERNEYSDNHSITKREYIVYLHRDCPLKFLLGAVYVAWPQLPVEYYSLYYNIVDPPPVNGFRPFPKISLAQRLMKLRIIFREMFTRKKTKADGSNQVFTKRDEEF